MNEKKDTVTINFNELKSGTNDPHLNKYIREIIIQSDDYIVYLDNDLNTRWNTNLLNTNGLGHILNLVSLLEAKSEFMSSGKWINNLSKLLGRRAAAFQDLFRDGSLPKIRGLLGEAIARIFDDQNEDYAQNAIKEAEILISAKNSEYSRRWYFGHASMLAGLAFLLSLVMWYHRLALTALAGETFFSVLFSSLFGAIGAFVFMARRGNKIELNAISGPLIHKKEASARISIGIVTAVLVSLLIKCDVIFTTISISHSIKFLVITSILAGYSEKIIPNIVTKFEATLSEKERTGSDGEIVNAVPVETTV